MYSVANLLQQLVLAAFGQLTVLHYPIVAAAAVVHCGHMVDEHFVVELLCQQHKQGRHPTANSCTASMWNICGSGAFSVLMLLALIFESSSKVKNQLMIIALHSGHFVQHLAYPEEFGSHCG